jgi:hypothetical protein
MQPAVRRRLGSMLGVAVICLLACAGPAVALSYDGMVSVELSGARDQSFVYDPTNPAVWQGTLHLVFDEKTTVALYGREQDAFTTKVLSESRTISGTWTNTYAPPNQAMTCTGSLSARPGAASPFKIYFGSNAPGAVGVSAQTPDRGFEIQSSAPESGQCGLMDQAGGPGFVSPDSVIAAEEAASPAQATVALPSNNYSKTYTASGSDRQVTESFHATLQVSTSGPTSGPGPPPKRTPAQIQAKRNALEALRQSAPAALYPCFSTAAGVALLAAGLPGQIAGGTLIAIGGPLCTAYNSMFQSEVQTINDPPRSDYGVVVRSPRARTALAPTVSCKGVPATASRACARARSAAQELLARTRAAAQLAKAIEVTISRETGAQRAHKTQAAARQNRKLIALDKSFADARRLERAAGSDLAKILRADRVSIRMTAGQVQSAQRGLLAALTQHKMTPANVAVVKRALTGRAVNVLNTLGY